MEKYIRINERILNKLRSNKDSQIVDNVDSVIDQVFVLIIYSSFNLLNNIGASSGARTHTYGLEGRHATINTIPARLAREAGFEPALYGVKVRCVTNYTIPVWSV